MKHAWLKEFNWPDDFDFETDETCQSVFKPFIEEQLAKLAALDAQRQNLYGTDDEPLGYIFHEHAERAGQMVKATALELGLGERVANNLYWATLAHDIGKAALPIEIWEETAGKPSAELKDQRRSHIHKSVDIINEKLGHIDHPFKDLMIDVALHHHEQLDGQGQLKLGADKLSGPVRLISIIEAYDGWTIKRKHFGDRDTSPAGVLKRMRDEKLHQFDKRMFDAFEKMMLQKNLKVKPDQALEDDNDASWSPSHE